MTTSFLSRLLAQSQQPLEGTKDFASFWTWSLASEFHAESPFRRAALAAARTDVLGCAFGVGYQAALRALVPSLPEGSASALCVTEAGGNHPRAIETALTSGTLSGQKAFVTAASLAANFLVVYREPSADASRPALRVAVIPSDRAGVELELLPDLGFVPELPHGVLRLKAVSVAESEVLPGDGYARYVKPFRTVEDIHVHGALAAFLLGAAQRYGWPDAMSEDLLCAIATLDSLTREPASDAALHLSLAGTLRTLDRLREATATLWASTSPELQARWERDAPLFRVASKAREQRRVRAWESLRVERR